MYQRGKQNCFLSKASKFCGKLIFHKLLKLLFVIFNKKSYSDICPYHLTHTFTCSGYKFTRIFCIFKMRFNHNEILRKTLLILCLKGYACLPPPAPKYEDLLRLEIYSVSSEPRRQPIYFLGYFKEMSLKSEKARKG